MAVITITPSAVLASNNAQLGRGIAGEAITQGKSLYIDTADSDRLKLYNCNGVSPTNVFAGISQNSASTWQVIRYVISDPIFTFGGSSEQSFAIFAGPGIGEICDSITDIESGVVTPIGSALSTTTMNFLPIIPSGSI